MSAYIFLQLYLAINIIYLNYINNYNIYNVATYEYTYFTCNIQQVFNRDINRSS